MLDKRLTLGGLQVGGPRTLQNPARFRVANNVYQTLKDEMIPRFGNDTYDSLPAGVTLVNSKMFLGLPFVLATDNSTGVYRTFFDGEEVVNTINPTGATYPDSALGVQFIDKNDTLYLNIPIIGIFKFDGIHVVRAGVPTSYGGRAAVPSGSETSTSWFRFVQINVDYAGNVVYSGYTQCTLNHDGSTLDLDGGQDVIPSAPGSFILGVGSVTPTKRQAWDKTNAGFVDFYYHIAASTSPTLVSGEWEIELDPGNYDLEEGCWVQWIGTLPGALAASLQAIKIDRLDGDTAYATKMKLFDGEVWAAETNIIDVNYVPDFATSQWVTVWTSDQETGNYVICDYLGKYETKTVDVSAPTTPNFINTGVADVFNIGGNLGDIYDVTTVKAPFPGIVEQYAHSMAVYADLLCVSGKNEILFNDTSLGGHFEMVNGVSFFTVGDVSNGSIQAICGTSRFMLISRQNQNFYLAGNLPTANYQSTPIANTSLGCYSNETALAVNDNIMFLNKTGIWALYSGGKCEPLSGNVKGLFSSFSETTDYAEEAKWNIDDFSTHASATATGKSAKWVKFRYDNSRKLLLILTRGSDDRGNALVLNLNNGEFYTWDKLSAGVFNDLDFYEANYYAIDGTDIVKEEKTNAALKYAYGAAELISTWFTGGEPSLEKKVQQLKIFGKVVGDLAVSHYKDWNDTAIEEVTYSCTDSDLFSHKKRIDAVNALAASVGIKFTGTKFEIEGLEIEFSQLQVGMKR